MPSSAVAPTKVVHVREIASLRGLETSLRGAVQFKDLQPSRVPRVERRSWDHDELEKRWYHETYSLSGVIDKDHLNRAGAVFGGNIISWLHCAAEVYLVGRVPHLHASQLYTLDADIKFSRPILEGDHIRIFPRIVPTIVDGGAGVQVDLLIAERYPSGALNFTKAAHGTFHFERTDAHIPHFKPDSLFSRVTHFSTQAVRPEDFSTTFKLFSLTDVLCCQQAFLDRRPDVSGDSHITNFVSRTYRAEFSDSWVLPQNPELKILTIPDPDKTDRYCVRWELGKHGSLVPWAKGEMIVVDIAALKKG